MPRLLSYELYEIAKSDLKAANTLTKNGACVPLGEMVGELVDLVPLVWKKIESLKAS